MFVSDILAAKSRPLITVVVGTSIPEAMSLLLQHRISCLLVIDDQQRLAGLVSDKDIFRLVYEEPKGFMDHTVGEVMTQKLFTALPSDPLHHVAALMTTHRIRHIPIVDNDRAIGLVSIGDVVKAQLDSMEFENRHLRKYISGDYPA